CGAARSWGCSFCEGSWGEGEGSAAGAGGAPAHDADELLAHLVIGRARPGEGDAGGLAVDQRTGGGILAMVEPGQGERHAGEADARGDHGDAVRGVVSVLGGDLGLAAQIRLADLVE